MREVLKFVFFCVGVVGITPAYAGSTHSERVIGPVVEDHPRVCGKYSTA